MSDEQTIIDGYQLINCVATGNDSQVWEVTEAGSGRQLAMKLLLPEARSDRQKVQTLRREGKAGQLFDHPNLIKIHQTVVTRSEAYLIMDYFRAPNLMAQINADLLSVHKRMTKLIEQLCLGLAYMHDRGWLHRDIKPENILLNRGSEVRLVDFSLAARYSTGLGKMFAGKSREIQGTKSYIAPETLLRKPPTPQTDMYSLGITLYLALTGELPITGMTPTELLKNHLRVIPAKPSEINPNVTPEMDAWIMQLLSKKPEKRFKTMDEAYSMVRSLKIFKEDIDEVERRREEEEKRWLREGVDAARRLDSRLDAQREGGTPSSSKRAAPAPAKTTSSSSPAKTAAPAQPTTPPAATPPAAGHPPAAPIPQPGYAPQPVPPMPAAAYPAAPVPGVMMPPGMPQPYPPGYYPPGVPYPAAPVVGQGSPPNPVPAAPPATVTPGTPAAAPTPVAGNPPASAAPTPAQRPPAKPAPAEQSPTQPAPAASASEAESSESDPDDLPFMEELPPVL